MKRIALGATVTYAGTRYRVTAVGYAFCEPWIHLERQA